MVKLILKYQYLIFFSIVLVFRLFYASSIVGFNQDQARDVVLMKNMAESGKLFFGYGPKTSVGQFYLAPFYYQLYLLLSSLSNSHQLVIHYFITVVESVTPLLFVFILQRFVSKKVAYISALLFAVSPLVSALSTFALNPNMIPFLTISSLLLFFKFTEDQKSWQLVTSIVLVAISIPIKNR